MDVIFLIGCPRSGTSMALNLLAVQRDFAWISNRLNGYPQFPLLAALNRLYDIQPIRKRRYLSKPPPRRLIPNLFPFPQEAQPFLVHYLSRFNWCPHVDIPRAHTPEDVTDSEAEKLRRVADQICRYHGRSRLLMKYTCSARIAYFSRIFPKAKFIHLVRDGRAVAYSQASMRRANRWSRDDSLLEWISQAWPEAFRAQWQDEGHTWLTHGAFEWRYYVNMIRKEARSLPDTRYHEMSYERLVKTPDTELLSALQFCGLEMDDRLPWYLSVRKLRNFNTKWQTELSAQERTALEEIFGDKYL